MLCAEHVHFVFVQLCKLNGEVVFMFLLNLDLDLVNYDVRCTSLQIRSIYILHFTIQSILDTSSIS